MDRKSGPRARKSRKRVVPADYPQRITELRKKRGLSQIELAKILHVHSTAVTKWERGGGINQNNWRKICELEADIILPVVLISSPYTGDTDRNVEYARRCLADSLSRGEAPIATHLMYPQVLSEPEDRNLAMEAAKRIVAKVDIVAVYADRGLSSGMTEEIGAAEQHGKLVETRYIEKEKPEAKPPKRSGFLDTSRAAAHLNVSYSYLCHLRSYGGGPRYTKIGRMVRYNIEDLDAWAMKIR